MQTENTNPLLCDIDSGVCQVPDLSVNAPGPTQAAAVKAVRIIYFTDPICSSCWGIEPQLRKLKLEYGHHFEMEYRMVACCQTGVITAAESVSPRMSHTTGMK
jgi:putative protein-disulfide isomerase